MREQGQIYYDLVMSVYPYVLLVLPQAEFWRCIYMYFTIMILTWGKKKALRLLYTMQNV